MKVSNVATGISLINVKVMLHNMLMVIPNKGNFFNSVVMVTHPRNTATIPNFQVSLLIHSHCL